jgi:methylmalonyl-CoA mutase
MADVKQGVEQEPLQLAGGFSPANYDTWRHLVEKALAGADFDKRLVARTADGLKIKPLYTRADVLAGEAATGTLASSLTRAAAGDAATGWQIVQRVIERDPGAANTVIMEELEGGATGILLQLEAPGQAGVAIAGADDFSRALAGVLLDFAPVELAAGLNGAPAARLFLAALAALKPKRGEAVSRLNVDPIGSLARHGTLSTSLDDALAEAVAIAGDAKKAPLPLTAVLVDATIPHEAGASEAQELGCLAAALVAYLRAFEKAGVPAADALATISFAVAVDTDLFLTAAKVRAARVIIGKVAQACGAPARHAHVRADTSRRMMARRDPWTNMLRTTAACAGAAFGGADAVSVLPFTWAIGAPDRFARRIARNTQLVLQEESSLGRVADPAGGSWYVERVTDDLARKAWEVFQGIEAKGGIAAALASGAFQEMVAQSAKAREEAVATGRRELTGVSVFPLLGDDGVKVAPLPAFPPVQGERRSVPLTPHRFSESFEALRDTADAYFAKHTKRPRVFLANLGEIADHNRRSTWVWNFLAAGGIEGLNNDGYPDAAAAARAYAHSSTEIAVICSSDAIYAKEAEATAKGLKAAGAKRVLMAGKPGESEAALRAAGVDGFLYAGQNAVTALADLHKALGVV